MYNFLKWSFFFPLIPWLRYFHVELTVVCWVLVFFIIVLCLVNDSLSAGGIRPLECISWSPLAVRNTLTLQSTSCDIHINSESHFGTVRNFFFFKLKFEQYSLPCVICNLTSLLNNAYNQNKIASDLRQFRNPKCCVFVISYLYDGILSVA